MTALLAASATTPSNPWSRSHKSWSFNDNSSNNRGGPYAVGYRRPTTTDPAADDQTTTTDCGETTLGDGDDDLVGVVDRLLSSRGQDEGDSLDLCSSTWQSVETMAKALATGQSVVSTISRCYRLPGLGRNNSGPQVAAEAVRCKARRAGTEAMHSSLLSGRFAEKALTIFRRCVVQYAEEPQFPSPIHSRIYRVQTHEEGCCLEGVGRGRWLVILCACAGRRVDT